jgi:GH18 family chitinase
MVRPISFGLTRGPHRFLGHFAFVTNAASRATFVANAVQMIEDYGFDGM